MSDSDTTTAPPQPEHAPGQKRRHRWRWWAAGGVATLVTIVLGATAVFQLGWPGATTDRDHDRTFRSEAGAMRYQVHIPPQHDSTTELPVIMAIHGCLMTGSGWNSMRETTQLNDFADREGLIVVYPTQRMFRDTFNCWSWDDPADQQRGRGEPALLAGIVDEVIDEFHGDPDQVHVTGASSGAGMAVIAAVTYPDVFATVTSVAGGEYALDQMEMSGGDRRSPDQSARLAWAQMGEQARQVPLQIVQGTEDEVVLPELATRLVHSWTSMHDLVDDGQIDDSIDLTQTVEEVPAVDGKHGYRHTTYTDRAGGVQIDYYLISGQGHAWSAAKGEGLYADNDGPEGAQILWDFAREHPMP